MASQHKGDFYILIKSSQNSPCQVLHHKAIFILTGTVVSMELEVDSTQVVMGEEVVKEANGAVCTLAYVGCLINEVVDLFER